MVRNLESLGFVAFSETRPIWLQRDRHAESLVLSVVSLVGAPFWLFHGRLSSWRIHCFSRRLHNRCRSFAKTDQLGLPRRHRATRYVVLFDLSDGVFFTHRLFGEPVSRARFGVAGGGAHGTLVAGWCARRAGLSDARTGDHSVSDTCRRSDAPILGRAALEMALALDRARAGRFRHLFIGELAGHRRPIRVFADETKTICDAVFMAVGGNPRGDRELRSHP